MLFGKSKAKTRRSGPAGFAVLGFVRFWERYSMSLRRRGGMCFQKSSLSGFHFSPLKSCQQAPEGVIF